MGEIVRMSAEEILPDVERVRCALGLPGAAEADSGAHEGARTSELLSRALDAVRACAEPVGVWKDVSPERFASIYRGEGANAPESPLAGIFPKAERLAIFAVTIGAEVERKIAELFQAREFALAAVLDAAASEAAERAAETLEERWEARFLAPCEKRDGSRADEWAGRPCAIRYSPGYCGWDVTGQRALFAELGPEAIGIRLGESCLMSPLKSISGAIVLGRPEIHAFAAGFPFCGSCRSRECVDRGRKAAAKSAG